MKITLLFLLIAILSLSGCSSTQTVTKRPIDKAETKSSRENETVAAHSVDKDKETKNIPPAKKVEKSDKKTRWTRGGDPIDTTKFDQAIEVAEKDLKAAANDPSKTAAVAEAYFKRGFALTQARQYAAAIGDYRAALKHEGNHQESKKWIATIANIYKTMNREIPKAGEEPKPLEFKPKQAS